MKCIAKYNLIGFTEGVVYRYEFNHVNLKETEVVCIVYVYKSTTDFEAFTLDDFNDLFSISDYRDRQVDQIINF